MYYIEEDHIPIVTTKLWDLAQETLNKATHRKKATTNRPKELNDDNYPYRNQLFCAECGHRLMRQVRADRVLWECNGKERFSKDFCKGVSVTDDEVQTWLPLEGRHYVYSLITKGKITGHGHMPEEEWQKGHQKKRHIIPAPDLTRENYPYLGRIFCKYCGSRLRRILSNRGKVFWICDGQSRNGKTYCKGVRVPDEKLQPLGHLSFDIFIGKEYVDGKESYGYSRKSDRAG